MTLLFDAANTIIHKPGVVLAYQNILKVETRKEISAENIRKAIALVSEEFISPDRPDSKYYHTFNELVLQRLNVKLSDQSKEELFDLCKKQEWLPFEDTSILKDIALNKIIVSNFNSSLSEIIEGFFPKIFNTTFISEVENLRKPDTAFYRHVLENLNLNTNEVLYFGDSPVLDVIPARSIGVKSFLIDRNNNFPNHEYRLNSLKEIIPLVNNQNQ